VATPPTYCVVARVLDGLKAGFDVTLFADAVQVIKLRPGDVEKAAADMVRDRTECATIMRVDPDGPHPSGSPASSG
jgi:hypothetical protein